MSDAMKLVGRATAEQNRKTISSRLWKSEDERDLVESMKRRFGIDIKDAKSFPIMESNFSWKKVKQQLREADSASSFNQVLRAGVQAVVNSLYESVPTTYEDWTHAVASNKDTELYAPLHGLKFPKEVGRQEKYPEVRAAGLDLKIQNKKYGTMYPIEKELLDDDQTGQFQKQAGLLGEYAKQVLEVLSYAKLASVAGMKYDELEIPVTETKPAAETTYPWNATGLVGGGKTRPSAYAALNQANIQAGLIALMNQLNLLGLKMSVAPDRLLISPHYRFDSAVLAHSSYYPSGAAAAGNVGGAFAINPLQGLFDITVSRFMFDNSGSVNADSKAWYLVDSKKPWFIVQVREAAVVEQENPMSGESFSADIYRFKVRTRANADFIDPRFAWQGSDGSV
jgi:phage major head subunit gpT-like protein